MDFGDFASVPGVDVFVQSLSRIRVLVLKPVEEELRYHEADE